MKVRDSVVVVTGASSGIGRATAVALARGGAVVGLLARRAGELDEVAAECAAAAGRPGRTIVLAADVSDAAAVEDAARLVTERFGRIDGWVNCAGVTMMGTLLDVPLADLRRVLEVNLMGCVHGARSALPRMITQGGGVLVNVSSILGVIGQPYGSAYTMSKFAVRGLGVSLRQELRLSGVRGVSISTVLPAAIDTPIYASAANYTGRRIQPPPPVYTPERVAKVIVAQLRHPRREAVAGGLLGSLAVLGHTVAPRLVDRLLADDVEYALSRTREVPATSGTLHTPAPVPGRVDGGWNGAGREARRRAAGLAAAAGALALLAARRR